MIEMAAVTQTPVRKAGYDMVLLVTLGLHGLVPELAQVEQMNLTNLYYMAEKHGLTAMVCMALESAGALSSDKEVQLAGKFKDAKEKVIRKNLLLDAERKELLHCMEREGIWYLPLKGIVLKELYPKLGMRQMADNDILYDQQYQKEVLHLMTGRGYEVSMYGKGNHDVYRKQPIYNYEMHTALYTATHGRDWENYYKNVKQRLIKDEGNEFGYHFSGEDFYIYLITHIYKHYNGSGTGVRSLLDLYVFLQQEGADLNWDYISIELDQLHLKEFEQESRQLSEKVFSTQSYPLIQEELSLLIYYLDSGTYGTMEHKIHKKLRRYQSNQHPITAATKIKYYIGRLIPDQDHYINYAPLVHRHPWLTPGYLGYRVVRGLIKNRKKIQKELQVLHQMEQ